ncbi:uncharacterized protein LOC132406918 isoform X3 [Hypanus sabinus]|uniref:uncharacterized protein LOC132406918 isoform X3 n=1 Tax=Hypanus sabinus TaxID=79690 RepID=UPI0028C392B2|nr:uncharacterized protein LOC132406918 isoform X3 [Hypanus sabinus]
MERAQPSQKICRCWKSKATCTRCWRNSAGQAASIEKSNQSMFHAGSLRQELSQHFPQVPIGRTQKLRIPASVHFSVCTMNALLYWWARHKPVSIMGKEGYWQQYGKGLCVEPGVHPFSTEKLLASTTDWCGHCPVHRTGTFEKRLGSFQDPDLELHADYGFLWEWDPLLGFHDWLLLASQGRGLRSQLAFGGPRSCDSGDRRVKGRCPGRRSMCCGRWKT